MNIKAIVTGASGMVGEGVLIECLKNPAVVEVLVIGRKPCGISHPKLREIIHSDFHNLTEIEANLCGYNACFFCLGVSSIRKSEVEYYRLTYNLTLHCAETLARLNPDMTFCYVSGAGTDSTEKKRTMWARVKGKTENALLQLPFHAVYAFRPGFLKASKGSKNILPFYKYIAWLYPILHALIPNAVCTLNELGNSMINSVLYGYSQSVLEVKDIKFLAEKGDSH